MTVIDDDLGVSRAGVAGRAGFAELAARVGLGEVGILIALEVSRLVRNNADWYKLLDLAGMTDMLIADADGLYHPAMFNDWLLLGMKGTMSEAELHILRARLNGGILNKAARGELRKELPSAWCGPTIPTAGSAFTPTRRWSGFSLPSLSVSPPPARVRATCALPNLCRRGRSPLPQDHRRERRSGS